MKHIFCLFLLLWLGISSIAQSVFIRTGSGTTTAYRSLDSVMANYQDGDTIYMPGGTFQVGTVTIAKKVFIYGAGHYPDSAAATGRTILNGDCKIIGPGSSGSIIQGFYLSGNLFLGSDANNSNLNGLVIQRCSFNDITLAANDGFNSLAVNVLLREIVVRSNINFRFAKDILVENCLVNGGLYNFNGSVKVSNNIIFGAVYCLNYASSSLFENNIFYQTGGFQYTSNSNTFRNNVFRMANPLGGSDIGEQNLFSVNNLFMVPNTGFDYDGNFHLAAGSPAIHAGKGGTDCGIFGGARPYKEAAVPSNPHIRSKTIADNTNASGLLQVQATVVAQGN